MSAAGASAGRKPWAMSRACTARASASWVEAGAWRRDASQRSMAGTPGGGEDMAGGSEVPVTSAGRAEGESLRRLAKGRAAQPPPEPGHESKSSGRVRVRGVTKSRLLSVAVT